MSWSTLNHEIKKDIRLDEVNTFDEIVNECHKNVDNSPNITIKEKLGNVEIRVETPEHYNKEDKNEEDFYYEINYTFELTFFNSEGYMLGDGMKRIESPNKLKAGMGWIKNVKVPVGYEEDSNGFIMINFISKIVKCKL